MANLSLSLPLPLLVLLLLLVPLLVLMLFLLLAAEPSVSVSAEEDDERLLLVISATKEAIPFTLNVRMDADSVAALGDALEDLIIVGKISHLSSSR